MNLTRRTENLVAKTGIESEARCQPDIVLEKSGEVGISLVPAVEARSASTRRDIADPLRTLVLRSALTQKQVIKRLNLQQAVLQKLRIHFYLVPFCFDTHADVVAFSRPGNGIL